MSENSTAPAPQPHAIPQGTPVTIATTVQPQAVAMPNPLMVAENWMPFLLLIAAVAAVVGLFTKHITGKFSDFEKVHKPIHEQQDREIAGIKHRIANDRARVDALDRDRQKDVERIVKVETQLNSIEKGQERIEHSLEKMSVDLGNRIDSWAEQFSHSIREVRDVKPR